MSHVSVLMSLQTLISSERAEGLDARIGFRLGDASYVATVHDGVSTSTGATPSIAR